MRAHANDRGTVLILVLSMAVVVAILCMVSLLVSHTESEGTHAGILRDQALFAAQAGLVDQIKVFKDIMKVSPSFKAFAPFEKLVGKSEIVNRPLFSDGIAVGEYTVAVDSVAVVDDYTRDVTVTSTGFVPSESSPNAVTRTVQAILRVGYNSAKAFEFVSFTGNYGWYGDSAHKIRGNVGSNGMMDFEMKKWSVTPYPRFKNVKEGKFGEKNDDGGVYASWDILGEDKIKIKKKGWKKNVDGTDYYVHPYTDKTPIPNLSDLAPYEADALANNSRVTIDGVVMCDAVVGDAPNEKPNLFLDGTRKPIVLNGTVVVRGNLIIKGEIKGSGSLYVKGNIYVAGNLKYDRDFHQPPGTIDKNIKVNMEKNLSENRLTDALGLFTPNSIVVGDYTDRLWSTEVNQDLADPHAGNGEDNGEDGIPNTAVGLDEIAGTADDDVLEHDGIWTTEHYTAQHAAAGMIPAGHSIGDPIPGTGEDTNGDGVYTLPTKVTDFALSVRMTPGFWAGNFPAGGANKPYSYFCARHNDIKRLDGAFFAGNTFAMYSKQVTLNGALVTGFMATTFKQHDMTYNYDLRLLEPDKMNGRSLPKTWQPLTMVMWKSSN